MTIASDPNSFDRTLNQTVGEQLRAEELSLRATVPPAQVPGYRLDRMLGQGAFGQVWVGSNLNTGRTVAIKFYLHRSGVNWSLLTREVKNLVSMAGNRFIVQVLEVGWDSEPPYYVMEYLENGSLDDLIRTRGAMPPSKAVELFFDIACGLNHSHGKGVLHCDLKPANVLLDQDMLPRLADFGQSRLSTEQTPSLGTLFYMAPEQADLNAVPDARWDVYALGAIFYCMIIGSPPYRTPDTVVTLDTAASLPERLKRYRDTIYKSHFPRAHTRVRGMDRWLIAIIDKCIAKKPDDRFANVQQVLAEIEKRQTASLRRPLMLLGIVGPILLMAVMGFFSWRALKMALNESSDDLRDGVLERNRWVARTSAGKLELEMANLFQLIEKEAGSEVFESKFLQCIDEAGDELLGSLVTEHTPPAESLEKLTSLDSRLQLEKYLDQRLNHTLPKSGGSKKTVQFASLFVTDRFGTMLAAAFSKEPESTQIGANFAYRSYFSGHMQDKKDSTPRRTIAPTTSSHVSVPFLSTTSNRWKIAVSTPIKIDRPREASGETDAENEKQVEGVLVLTINLGDFELLSEDRETDPANQNDGQKHHKDRFAVLVDGHEGTLEGVGTREGILLQHPVFSSMNATRGSIDEPGLRFKIGDDLLKTLQEKGTKDYEDPVSEDERGKAFSGKWIAAMERVDITRRISDTQERKQSTNLWVLVQERADSVTAPVAGMEKKLIWEGFIALLSLLGVISMLWIVVLWVMRIPGSFGVAVRSRASGGTEMTGTANEATLDVEQ